MQKQYNVSLCLYELHNTMKSLILESKCLAQLLTKFSTDEIKAHLPKQRLSFLQDIDEELRERAEAFCHDLCEDLAKNQKKDAEHMVYLQTKISEYSKQYAQSRKNVTLQKKYRCPQCQKDYTTQNGLHNHIKKNKCTGAQQTKEARSKRGRLSRFRRLAKKKRQQSQTDD